MNIIDKVMTGMIILFIIAFIACIFIDKTEASSMPLIITPSTDSTVKTCICSNGVCSCA